MKRLLVDGMNVIGSRPDGWWRDRRGAWRRLHQQLSAYAAETGEQVRLVLDGRRPPDWDDGPVETTFARGRRGAADEVIVELVEADPDPGSLLVTTSDRELADRVRSLGAGVEAASGFRKELERLGE